MIKPHLYLGPAFNVLVSAKSNDTDIKEMAESTTIDMVVGGGVKIKSLSFDIRYTLGLTDTYKGNMLVSDESNRNAVFSFMIGYSIL